jgi:hypothetical protein
LQISNQPSFEATGLALWSATFKQCDCETDDLIYQFHKSVSDPFLIRVLCDQCKKECKFEKKALF